MKRLHLITILLALQTVLLPKLYAQVNMGDSLALVALYNQTDGPNWNNNNNWLTAAPIDSWYGISTILVPPTDKRVVGINLPNNNLKGTLPQLLQDNMNALQNLRIQNNQIDGFPDFEGFNNLNEFNCKNNRLDFEDFEGRLPCCLGTFEYQPQQKYREELNITRNHGKSFTFYGGVGGSMNTYQWYKNGIPLSGKTNPSLNITALNNSHAGDYYCKVNSNYPDLGTLELQSETIYLTVGDCQDGNGGTFACDQLIIRFKSGTTQAEIDSVADEVEAEIVQTCPCTDIVVFGFLDNADVEEKGVAVTKELTVDGIDFNYDIFVDQSSVVGTPPIPPILSSPPSSGGDVVVALIDTGVDYQHALLYDRLWRNNLESTTPNGIDTDNNCYEDDIQGYNFVHENWDNYDHNGHGTHIAGIIAQGTPNNVKILNAKAFDDDGSGSIFAPICAIYYAAQQNAKIINLSWGYYGNPSPLLREAIVYAQETSGALVVASAGNDSLDARSNLHFPSGYNLDNIVTVAALNEPQDDLARSYSNWGDGIIDLAAPGTRINSTQPYNSMVDKTGTSMAAGFVSKTAAMAFLNNPAATFRGVKHCLLANVQPLPPLSGLVTTGGKLNPPATETCILTPLASADQPLLDLKIMLEGPYEPTTGLMNDHLRLLGLIPSEHPFNTAPWFYEGTDTVSTALLSVTGPEAIVDWVLVRYFNEIDSTSSAMTGLLKRNGSVVDVNNEPLSFEGGKAASRILITTRNHLNISSEIAIPLDYLPTIVDFTNGTVDVKGGNSQLRNYGLHRVLWAGDADYNGEVKKEDADLIWLERNTNGYLTTDVNNDGKTDATDRALSKNNKGKVSACEKCYEEVDFE